MDASFGDILDNLDGAFMGHFMAEKGPWTLGLEAVWMNLESESSGAVTGPGGMVSVGGRLDVDTSLYIYQGTVAYRVLDDATRLDLLGGLRFTELDADLRVAVDFTPGIVFPGGANVVSGSESWADFVVGARVLHPLSDSWTLMGYRYLYWDYQDDGSVWDMAASGPYLGLGIRF